MDWQSEKNFMSSGRKVAKVLKAIVEKYGAESCAEGVDGEPKGLLEECKKFYFDPENNIQWSLWLYEQEGWSPWGTAPLCGLK